MPDAPRRRHYALGLSKVKGGFKIDYVIEYQSRGEADVRSISLARQYSVTAAVTVERELAEGDIIDRAVLGR